jgi:hypothetical protein
VPTPFERALLVACTACWAVALAHYGGLVSLAGHLPLSLYALYSTAAAAGWLFGNVYARRRARLLLALKRRVLLLYWLGPPAMLYLLRALAPAREQIGAPLVPLWALGVYAVLFLVPVTITWVPGARRDRDDHRKP